MLVIVSDHSQDIAEAGNKDISLVETRMAFIAVNSGINRRIENTVGQIDVYPTILYLANVKNAEWRGVGYSMLDSTLNSAFIPEYGQFGEGKDATMLKRQKEAYNVSDLIIKGDYFKSQK